MPAESDVDALRKELGSVKDKAKAYISRLNEEKAVLSKELHDKSTVLAGVKDKTKAYVEKLNAEKAAAIAAVENQVKDRDDRLSRAKELLRAKLEAKDQELEAAKAESHSLRVALEESARSNRSPEVNGDGVAPAAEEATQVSADAEALKEKLESTLEALRASESSRLEVENLLAEAKQAAHEAGERATEAEKGHSTGLAERDEALALVETLKASLATGKEAAARELQENAREARAQAEAELEGVRREAAVALEQEQAAVRSLEERLEQAQARAEASSAEVDAAHEAELETLRSRVAATEAASAESFAASSATAAALASAEASAAMQRAAEAKAEASRHDALAESLATAEGEVSRLRGELARAEKAAEAAVAATAAADAESLRQQKTLRDQIGAMEGELGGLREKLRVAAAAKEEEEGAPAAPVAVAEGNGAEGAATDAVVPATDVEEEATLGGADERVEGEADSQVPAEEDARSAPVEIAAETAAAVAASAAAIAAAEDLRRRVDALEEELAESKRALHEAEEAAALEKEAAVRQAEERSAAGSAEAAAAAVAEARTAAAQATGQVEDAAKETEAVRARLLVLEAEAEKAGRDLAAAEEALTAARGEAEKARGEARVQAEELSSRLMGALEEREEGRRREGAASKEVGRLREQLTEAAAALEKERRDAAAAAAAAAASASEWARKLKGSEEKAETAESGAVGIVKSLEDALTQREEEVGRLRDEASGLRKEMSLAKAELEARGEALRQAKLDLASAVEEAGSAVAKATDMRSKLETALAEHEETKIRLKRESAANAGLKAAVMEANETVSNRVDVLREAIEKTESERDAATADAASSKTQVQALQAQVASLLRENAGAKTEAGLRAGDLKQRLSAAQNELAREREAIAERKKEMQTYAEAMAKEGESLRAATREAQTVAARATAGERAALSSVTQAKQEGEAAVSRLRQAMEKQRAEASQVMEALQERNEALESETSNLQHLMTLETGQREEKAQGLQQSLMGKIEEANLHKKKRLAARSEMISLARTLEVERDGHKAVGNALQYGLVPKAIEQATLLEHVVRTAERSVHNLSRASGVRLATSLQAAQASLARLRGRVAGADDPHIAWHQDHHQQQQQSSDLSRMALIAGAASGGGPEDASSSVISDRMDSPLGSAASGDQSIPGFWQGYARGSSRLSNQAAKDSAFLDRVRRLESEMERVSSGLALVSQSVDQVAELVEIQASLCGGFSVLCCPSRRTTSRGTRGPGAGGGPVYSTLEMGSRRLDDGGENGAAGAEQLGRHGSSSPGGLAGLIRG